MKITFRGVSATHVAVFNGADFSVYPPFNNQAWHILGLIRDPTVGEQTFPRLVLLQGIKGLQQAIKSDRQLLPYHYSFEVGIGEMRSKGSGGVGGIHINGKYHCVWSGPGHCYLEEMGVRPNGIGEIIKRIDIRDQKRIETDNFGTLKVLRRKLKLTLFENIPAIVTFLEHCADTEIRVRASENNPSFMDLVRAVEQGGGADDWAGEQILEMGEKGKRLLLEKLVDPKAKKHCYTIGELLLSLFPSTESREGVERLLEKEQNEDLKRLYAILLSVAPK